MLLYLAKIARTPYLLAHGPDANAVAATPMTATLGTPVHLTASINYSWAGNQYVQNVAAAEYYIDTPPWAGGAAHPMTGTFTTSTVSVMADIDTAGLGVGRHIVFVRGRGADDYGGFPSWGPVSAAFVWLQEYTPTPTPTATPTPTPTVEPMPQMWLPLIYADGTGP